MQTVLMGARPSSTLDSKRYFIELRAPYPSEDKEGEFYESAAHAREDALLFLADLIKDRAREIQAGEMWQVLVYDDKREIVFRLNFSAEAML